MANKIPVIIDTDIGDDIDDAFALCLAMQSPELDILGITTVHRCAKQRAQIAKKLLQSGGYGHIPVHAGLSKPLSDPIIYGRKINFDSLPSSYGSEFKDTVYDGDDAVGFIAETLQKSPVKITIITLGALTNIAKLITDYPHIIHKIEKITIMGGAFSINLGEYNFSCDPVAAGIVLDCALPKTCVGVDITFKCKLEGEYLSNILSSDNPCLKLLTNMNKRWGGEVYLHDPLALMSVYNDSFIKFERRICKIETNARYANGYVINLSDFNWKADNSQSSLEVGVDVDNVGFVEEYYNRIKNFLTADQSLQKT